LVDGGVHVLPKPPDVHTRAALECGSGGLSRYEHPLAQRNQLANRYAVAGDDERLPAV